MPVQGTHLALGVVVLGGLVLAGPAPAADYSRATPEGKAQLPSCGRGFPDPSGRCWECPPGYKHNSIFLPPTHGEVCKKAGRTEFSRGLRQGPSTLLVCPPGQWLSSHDLSCYKCPPAYAHDMKRTGNDKRVCFRTHDSYARAKEAGGVLCGRGFFDPVGGGTCWSCPPRWYRTAAPVNGERACTDELGAILAVDSTFICRQVVTGLAEGQKGASRLMATLDKVLGPALKPVEEGLRSMTDKIQTPAEVDTLVERLGQSLQPYGHVVEEVQRLSDQLDKAGGRLRDLLLDPKLMCEGTLAERSERLKALGLRPNLQSRKPGVLDDMLMGTAYAASKTYTAAVVSVNVIIPELPPITMALTFVTDFAGSGGVFYSVGFFAATTSGGADLVGFNVGVFVFPYSDIADFDEIGTLSAEIGLGPGERLKALLEKTGLKGRVPDSLDFSFDPRFWDAAAAGSVPGIGVTKTLKELTGAKTSAFNPIAVSGSLDVSLRITP
jgi:hypothetical protein